MRTPTPINQPRMRILEAWGAYAKAARTDRTVTPMLMAAFRSSFYGGFAAAVTTLQEISNMSPAAKEKALADMQREIEIYIAR